MNIYGPTDNDAMSEQVSRKYERRLYVVSDPIKGQIGGCGKSLPSKTDPHHAPRMALPETESR